MLYNTIYEIGGFYAPETPEVKEQSIDYFTERLDFAEYPLVSQELKTLPS